MKGITPIISIIILLLITIGLASVAWTYMSVYMSNLIGKRLEILPPSCIGGTQVSFLTRNIGTNNVGAGDIYGMNLETGSAVTINWFELDGNPSTPPVVLSPSASKMAKLSPNCTTVATSKICSYTFTISGSSWKQDVSASCNG